MKFQLKALAAALALVAAVPANAALDNGLTGNGELFFAVYDTVSNQSFAFDLTPQALASAYGNFTVNDFLPADLSNAQGLAATTPLATVAGFNAAGAAEVANQSIDWTFSGAVQTQFNLFKAANANTANWQWNVVALDTTGTTTGLNGRRYLSTIANGVGFPITQASGLFSGMSTVSTYLDDINAATAGQADPAVYLTTNYFNTFGDTWLGNLPDSTGGLGQSLSFVYATGRSGTSIVEQFENAAKWTFTMDANGIGKLNYATAAVPEADTWAMMMLGLGFMGFVARRRRAN